MSPNAAIQHSFLQSFIILYVVLSPGFSRALGQPSGLHNMPLGNGRSLGVTISPTTPCSTGLISIAIYLHAGFDFLLALSSAT